MGGRIQVLREDELGWLVIDHPERHNAITLEMWQAIPEAAAELEADEAVRVVLLRGAGEEAFVSGADISEFERSRVGDAVSGYERDNARAFLSLSQLEKPVLAMIHGFCVGGGAALALTADVRYAADDGVFAIPAAKLGLGYAMHGLEALCNVVGYSNAKEIFFTAQRYSAEQAHQLGLVNRVLPKAELEGFVREQAERIAGNAPLTIRSVKQIIGQLARDPTERDLAAVAEGIRACMESEDYREGMRAFLEKRRPVFRGR